MSSQQSYAQYRIPLTLTSEISDLEQRINDFLGGTLSAAQLKVFRVPFGIYEQRVKGLYMTRIRCAAGIISPSQLGAVARLSQEHGSGTLHITTRQELQIHDVPIERLIPLLRALAEVNLSTRGGGGNTVRNITASWDAGIAKDEPFDVTPHAVELTSRLVALPDSWLLPRKFKIAFSNGTSDSAFATVNDVGFVASVNNGVRGFRVFVAGGMGRNPQPGLLLHDFVREDEVFLVAEALKRLFSRNGNRRNKHSARLRFLWNRLGSGPFVELYNKERDAIAAENSAPFAIDIFQQSHVGIALAPEHAADTDAFALWRNRYVNTQNGAGLASVRIPFLLGNISAAQADALARALQPYGDDTLRFTQDQNIVVRNIPETHLRNLYNIIRQVSPLSGDTPLFGGAVACAGASTCQLGICRSRGALSAAVGHLRTAGTNLDALGSFRLHISGCTNSCGQHAIADLGFAGKAAGADGRRYPAYTVFAGAQLDGRSGSRLAGKAGEIPARDLPEFVQRLFDHYLARKQSYSDFRAYLAAEGLFYVNTLCAGFHPVASYENGPHYYRDFDDTVDFSLEGRGTGECAAGLFDLIDIDIAKLRELRQTIAAAPGGAERPELLHELAFVTAHALLAAKGVDAAGAAVFDEFRNHFIDEGLISSRYIPLIDTLRTDYHNILTFEQEVIDLTQAVESLYATMDDTLQFHRESTPPAPPPLKADAEKDLRGVACPMNFVKTKMALAKLQSGQLLRILLDDGAPIDNVPGSVEAEGHTILVREQSGNHWSVVVKKR